MDLFTYLLGKKGHNTHRDLFSYLLGKSNQLPSGYQRLEYIESTGTQYINTGVNLAQNSSIELSISMNEKDTRNKMLFGSRTGASDNNISINATSAIVLDFNNSSYATYRTSFDYETNTKYILYNSKEKRVIYDENHNVLAQNTTICNDTITTPQTATLFYINPKPSNTWYNANAKIYYCKIWNNGKLIRNFIPCVRNSDNVVGLYDLANDTFYKNAGTGTFVTPTTQLSSIQSLNAKLLSQNINDIQSEEEPNIDDIQEEPNLDYVNELEETEEEVS